MLLVSAALAAMLAIAVFASGAEAKKRKPGKPDLVASAVTASPGSITPGGSLQIGDTTANKAKGSARPSVTTYVLSTDTVVGGVDLPLGERSVSRLRRGKSSAGSTAATVPASLLPGTYFVIGCADGTAAVRERSERNNCSASAAMIVASPLATPLAQAPASPPNALPVALFSSSSQNFGSTNWQFTSQSSDSDGTIVSTDWDFDGDLDFNDASGPVVTHDFGSGGPTNDSRIVRVRVTDDDGGIDVDAQTVVLKPDGDNDGDLDDSDCAPTDPNIYFGAPETPAGGMVDQNCDGVAGNRNSAILVWANDPNALDDPTCGLGPTGTGAGNHPCRTLTQGFARSVAVNRPNIFVGDGTYEESVTLPAGKSIYGGFGEQRCCFGGFYGNGFDVRSAPHAATVINRTASSGRIITLTANGITTGNPSTIQLLSIRADSTTALGVSVYGVYAADSPGLTLDQVMIEAGNGGPGFAGTSGTDGADGGNGSPGTPGSCGGPGGTGAGGAGASHTAGITNVSGGAGGNGGRFQISTNPNGSTGSSGLGSAPGAGGAGGIDGGVVSGARWERR